MVRVSVVTLTWNHVSYTKKAVKSLVPLLTKEDEFIFVDNNSDDGTKEYLESLKLPCRKILHFSDKHISITKAYNIGIKNSSGEFVFIWDNDLEIVDNNTIEKLINIFSIEKDAGIVYPFVNKVINPIRSVNGPESKTYELHEIKHRSRRPYPSCPSAAWLIHRKVIDKIGGFDERYTSYGMLDFDYAKTALLAGFKIFIDGSIYVEHGGSITANDYMKGKNTGDIYKYNRTIFNRKWGFSCPGDPGVPKGGWRR